MVLNTEVLKNFGQKPLLDKKTILGQKLGTTCQGRFLKGMFSNAYFNPKTLQEICQKVHIFRNFFGEKGRQKQLKNLFHQTFNKYLSS